MGRNCGKASDRDLTVSDRNGEKVKLGSIVEITRVGNDAYKGLWYVVGFEADPDRGVRVLLAATRWEKWDLKVNPKRVSLRCYEPLIPKGEI